MKSTPAMVRLGQCGRIVIGLVCPNGCCIYERELTIDELNDFVDALAVEVKLSKRVRQLRLPWIHQEGEA